MITPFEKNKSSSADRLGKEKSKPLDSSMDEFRRIVMQGELMKYMDLTSNIQSRYIVLNKYALFTYKDELSFQSFPSKPQLVVPLQYIGSILTHKFKKSEICKGSSMSHIKDSDPVYVLDI